MLATSCFSTHNIEHISVQKTNRIKTVHLSLDKTLLNQLPTGSSGLRKERRFGTGLVTRPVSAARLRVPGFRFFVVSYVICVRARMSVVIFYEPRLAFMLNVRALLVTVIREQS